ncbi:TetR/AcrR family transcriptional regulator [Pseudonocardia asaccharolytica]|uniref:DNA-binding protein n=1 Tax=Pseudonocardia asaccharolytica DSM 44247 = NBRC 16224 TaxID=1123024 RepID=A0A511D9F0_9PSEU|nr:TetR/AcrR family transcriptional regulator [Pseudonocardia asaccharolytica]GEL19578.1 DNA-binding protein [Pseudonocardia asaccharolytica DSM 44247 = NBRC 16224]
MARAVNPSTRRYRSQLRAEQAQDTRRRILEAATRLFVANGYAGTTVSAVAAEAGVVPETIYGTLGGKRGLLEGVIDTTIVAYRGPLLDAEHEPSGRRAKIDRLATAQERLRAWAEFACEVLAHTSPIHALIRGAADSEPFAVELLERLLCERLADITESMRRYAAGSLRAGLSVEQAGERACALMSPEMHHLLTVGLGWTPEQHREWLCQLIVAELLGPP